MKKILSSLIFVFLIFLYHGGYHQCQPSFAAPEKDIKQDLIAAVENNEHDTIESLLKNFTAVDFKDKNGSTPLMAASEFGDSAAVRLLIKSGANVNATNNMGKTPLMLSVNYERLDNARELIAAGAEINARDSIYKMSAFLYSVKFGYVEMAKILVENNADLHAADCYGDNALAIAVRHNNAGMAKFLIDLKFDPNGMMIEKEGETFLMYAAGKGMYDIARLLIEKGADVNKKTVYGFSALVYSAVCGVDRVEDLIIEKSEDIKGGQGTYALGIAVLSENDSMIEKLAGKGADLNAAYKPVAGDPFYDADPVNGLVGKIINNGVVAKMQFSPLMIACVTGNSGAVKKLIECGAGVDSVEDGCHTPLMASLNFENFDIARFLIERGANVNAKNARGETPLALAAYLKNYELTKLLLERGAMFDETAENSANAALITLNSGDEKLFKLFTDRGADASKILNLCRQRFNSPIQNAIESENISLLKTVLKSGADPNQRFEFGQTPLSLAARCGNYEAARVLIERGADLDYPISSSYSTDTALDVAVQSGSDETVKLLMERGYPFDKAKLDRLGTETNGRLPELAGRLGLEPRRFYSSRPWNIKGFPAKIRKIINDEYGYKNKTDNGEIVRDTLPVAIDENIDVTSCVRMTALQYFTETFDTGGGNNGIIKILLENKADLYAGSDGRPPLTAILERGNREIYDYLVEKGYDIRIGEKELSRMIVMQTGHRPEESGSIKILFDIAKRKKYALAGGDEIWKTIIHASNPAAIKYLFDNGLFGIDRAGTNAVELACAGGEKNSGSGASTNSLANALYIAKLSGVPCDGIVGMIEKSRKISSMTLEVLLASVRSGNVGCVKHFSEKLKGADRMINENFLEELVPYHHKATVEAEFAKLALKLIESDGFKIDGQRKKLFVRRIVPALIKAGMNGQVESFMAGYGFDDGELCQAMIFASASSNNYKMNRYLMFNLPLGYKAMLTEVLLRDAKKEEYEDRSPKRSREEQPGRKQYSRVYESIRAGSFDEFKKVFETADRKEFSSGDCRSLFQKALDCRNDEIAKYLIGAEKDFYDKYYVESAISAGRFDLADLAVAKGAAVADPEYAYFFAIRDDKPAAVDYLLKIKADPNRSYSNEGPIVAVALKWNRPGIFMKLVEGGADLAGGGFKKGHGDFFGLSGKFSFSGMNTWVKPSNDSTLLIYAIAANKRREALFLASRQPGINDADPSSGKCALELAVERNFTEIALEILKRRDVDLKSAGVKNALVKAIEAGNAPLIKRFADIGVTACADFRIETLKKLVGEKKGYTLAIMGAMAAEKIPAADALSALSAAGAPAADILTGSVKMRNMELTKACLASAGTGGASGEPGRIAMIAAVEDGNLEAVELLLKYGAAPDSLDFFRTPIAVAAAMNGRADILKALAESGANLEAASPFGVDPLYASLRAASSEALDYLMSKKVRTDRALLRSIEYLHAPFVEKLLSRGARPDACDRRGVNALRRARDTLQYDVEDMLLKHGADISYEPPNAAALKIFDIIEKGEDEKSALQLVSKVTNLEEKNEAGETPLIASMKKWNVQELPLALVRAGADLSAADSSDTTALMYLLKKNIKGLDYGHIISNSNCADRVNNERKNALFFYEGESPAEVEMLLNRSANMDQADNSGMTPLLRFINERKIFIADLFIKRGAGLRVKNRQGANALMLLSQKCSGMTYEWKKLSEDMADELIAKTKSCIDDRDQNGETALMMAARSKLPYFVKALLKAGARVDLKDAAGEAVLTKACDRESAAALLEAGALTGIGPKNFDDGEFLRRLLSNKNGEKNFGALRLILDSVMAKAPAVDEKIARDFLNADFTNGLKSLIYIALKKNESQEKFFETLFAKPGVNEKHVYESLLEAGSGEQLKCLAGMGKTVKLSEDGWSELIAIIKSDNLGILPAFMKLHGKFEDGIMVSAARSAFYYKMPEAARIFLSEIDTLESRFANEFRLSFIMEDDTQGVALIKNRRAGPGSESEYNLEVFIQCLKNKKSDMALWYFERDPVFFMSAKTPEGLPMFIFACKSGSLELAGAMKKTGGDPNMKGPEGRSALYFAASNGDMPMIKFLEESGADLNIKNDKESIPILCAAEGGSVEAVKYFHGKGQSLNCKNKFGLTPLIASLMAGKTETAVYLINNGAEIDCIYNEAPHGRFTPLKAAITGGDFEIIKLLIDKGANLNEVDAFETAAYGLLRKAVEKKRPDIFKFLRDKGVNIDRINFNGCNILHFASMTGNFEMVKALVDSGCVIDYVSSRNETALAMSLSVKNAEISRYLFSIGASAKMPEKREAELFECALACGCDDIASDIMKKSGKDVIFLPALIKFKKLDAVKKIIEAGAAVDQKVGNHYLVSHAAREGAMNELKYFIEKGASINVRDVEDRTPLLHAALAGGLDSIKFLVEKGADLNAKDSDRNTPLMLSARCGSLDSVKFFREKGQDVNQMNKKGMTPLIAACMAGNADLVSYLLSSGASLDGYYSGGENLRGGALFFAAKTRNIKIVRSLIDAGANMKSFAALEALNASLSEYTGDDIFQSLIDAGVDYKKSSDYSDYPIYYAVKFMRTRQVKFFLQNGLEFDLSEAKAQKTLELEKHIFNSDVFSILRKAASGVRKNGAAEKTARLNKAITTGDTAKAMEMLQGSFEVGVRDERYNTPLFTAVETGNVEIAGLLLKRGADPNTPCGKDIRPLTMAVRSKKIEMVKLLAEKGADINYTDDFNTLPLVLSVIDGSADIFEYLTGRGARLDSCSGDGHTPLTAAAAYGRKEMLEYLIKKGAEVKKRNRMGDTALALAAAEGDRAAVKSLSKTEGPVIEDKNKIEFFRYCDAIEKGSTGEVLALIRESAGVNCTGKGLLTPLMVAARKGNAEIARMLIKNGARADVEDASGKTFLDHYLESFAGRQDEVFLNLIPEFNLFERFNEKIMTGCNARNPGLAVKLIGRAGAGKVFGEHTRSWLMTAIEREKYNIAVELIKSGADVKFKDKNGMSALTLLCGRSCGRDDEKYHTLVAARLLEAGAPVNDQDAAGDTALHYAARSGLLQTASLLVDRGGSVNIKNKKGETPFMLTLNYRWRPEHISKLLLSGADPFPSGVPDDLPVLYINILSSTTDASMIKILLDRFMEKNKKPAEETIGRIMKIEPVKGIPAALYIAQKTGMNAEQAYNRYFYNARPGDDRLVRSLIEFGNAEYLELFRKKGLKPVLSYNPFAGLMLALKNRNYDSAAIILREGSVNDTGVSQAVITSIEAKDDRAVKLILNLAATAEINFRALDSLFENFLRNSDVEGIFWLAERKKTEADKRVFYENTLNRMIESENAPEKKFAAVFEKFRAMAGGNLKSYAPSFLRKSIDHKKYDLFFHIENLLKAGRDKYNSYSLPAAAAAGEKDLVIKILKNGADPDSADETGNFAIQRAVDNSKMDVVELLIENGASLKGRPGANALASAMAAGSMETVAYLLKKGADPNAVTSSGKDLLWAAVMMNRPDMLEALIAGGAFFDPASPTGRILIGAASRSDGGKFRKILEKGPGPDAVKKFGPSVRFNELIRSGGLKDISGLVGSLKLIDYRDENGNTHLYNAITYGRFEAAEALVSKGADVNVANIEGKTPLIMAVWKGNEQFATALLEKGADPSLKDHAGRDALAYAILNEDDISCSAVLRCACGPGRPTIVTSAHIKAAEERRNTELVELLTQYTPQGARQGKSFAEKRRMSEELTRAALAGDTISVTLFLDNSPPQKINQDKLISLMKRAVRDGDAGMAGVIGGRLSEFQKITNHLTSMILDGWDNDFNLKIMIRSLPEKAFENAAKQLAMESIRAKKMECLDVLLEKTSKYIKSFELDSILNDPSVTCDRRAVKILLKRLGNFREPACAGFFCNALKKGDLEGAGFCLGWNFDFSENECARYSEILKTIGRYGDPKFIETASKSIDTKKFGFDVFRAALAAGRIDNMQRLTELGVELAPPERRNITATALAAKNYAAAVFVLNNGADPDVRDREGLSALMHAAMTDETELAETAIKKGANIALTNETGETALDMARVFKSRGVEKVIENFRGAKNLPVNDVYRLMGMLAGDESEEAVIKIINGGYNAGECTASGKSLLQRAIELKRLRTIEALLLAGANPLVRPPHGESAPLEKVLASGDEAVLAAFVRGIGGMNSTSCGGETLLSLAVKGGHHESALALLKMKSDPAARNVYGKTARDSAREQGRAEMLSYLEDTDAVDVLNGIDAIVEKVGRREGTGSAEIEFRGADGRTALMDAISGNQHLRMKYLLAKGADVRAIDAAGKSVFQYALANGDQKILYLVSLYCGVKPGAKFSLECGEGYVAIRTTSSVSVIYQPKTDKDRLNIELLSALGRPPGPAFDMEGQVRSAIEKGADVNYAIPPDGVTPLMRAISMSEYSLAKMLVEKGADINAVDKNSRSVLIYACDHQSREFVKLLIDNGLDLKSAGGRNGFVYGALFGNVEFIKFMLELGADVNSLDERGHTALMMTAMAGNTGAIKLLLEKGADVTIKDSEGKTAVDFAAGSGNEAAFKMLKK